MGFLSLFQVAAMPIVEVLLVCILGAFMATDYFSILPSDARKSLNKIVYTLFTPALVFASLTKTVTLEEIISWWFMPVNIGLTFLFGGILGWILVKVLKPEPYLEGLVISVASAGNLGNLLLIMVHAICQEAGSPFGDHNVCNTVGLSYAAFSMAAGGFYIWTFAFAQIRSSAVKYEAYLKSEEKQRSANKDFEGDQETAFLKGDDHHDSSIVFTTSRSFREDYDKSAIAGFFFGAITWLKNLIVGETAPLILPIIGIGVVKFAASFGFLPADPLFSYVLMIQFTLPPAMNIGTMTQLVDVGQAECSVLFLWTYIASAFALTIWSTVFMWILG